MRIAFALGRHLEGPLPSIRPTPHSLRSAASGRQDQERDGHQHEGEQDAAGGGVELRQAEIHQVRPGIQHADPKVHGLRPLIESAEQRERDAAGRGEDGPGVGGAAGEEPEDERRGQGDAHQRVEDGQRGDDAAESEGEQHASSKPIFPSLYF